MAKTKMKNIKIRFWMISNASGMDKLFMNGVTQQIVKIHQIISNLISEASMLI